MVRSGRRRARWASALAATVASVLVAGCGAADNAASGSGTIDEDATFRISYPVVPSLDPRQQPEPTKLLISTWPVYDRLIQVSTDSKYEPMLATSWEFSADGTSLTLELRTGVTFSDGTPFDADVVKANLDDSLAAKGTALQQNLASIAKVDVVDSDTVKLDLVVPTTTVLYGLSSALGGSMISPKALADGGTDLATKPVGTGAYVIDSYTPGQEITYKRRSDNGGIWDKATGKPARISIRTLDVDAQANAMKSGQLDLAAWSHTTEAFSTELGSGQLDQTVMGGVLNMAGLNFNKTIKPFDDPLVRQAVNYAIDRKALVEAFIPDGTPRVQPWPDGLPGFSGDREDHYAFDPDKAKDLLRQAGHADGLDAGELIVNAVGAFPEAAQVIQSNLADVGIDVELRTVDGYALIEQWAKGTIQASLTFLSLPSIDSSAWLQRLFDNPVWVPGGADSTLKGLIAGTGDPRLSDDERAAKVDQAVAYATDQALYAPLWQGVGGFVSRPTVKNLDKLASVNGGVPDFRDVYMTK